MGARTQIRVAQYGDAAAIYLYGHWSAGNIIQATRKALLEGESRIDDPEYFARIAFDRMKGDDVSGLLSFGIGTSEHCDLDVLITVDGYEKIITVFPCNSKNQPLFDGTIAEFLEWSIDGKEVY